MKQKKEKRITLRVTPEQYEAIQSKVETAQMSTGAYVRAAALRHRVMVIGGLKEFTHELKGIGRNVNQLVVLANMGKIKEVRLGETMEALGRIYHQLRDLTDQEHPLMATVNFIKYKKQSAGALRGVDAICVAGRENFG